jgi:hypothetical protein
MTRHLSHAVRRRELVRGALALGGLTLAACGGERAPERRVTRRAQEFGARGDGTSDDWAALQKGLEHVAVAGGGELLLPKTAGGYRVSKPVIVPEAVTLKGAPGANLGPLTAVSSLVVLEGEGSGVSGLALLALGLAALNLVFVKNRSHVDNCQLMGSGATQTGIQADGAFSDFAATTNLITSCRTAIHVSGSQRRVHIVDNTVRAWTVRGIYLLNDGEQTDVDHVMQGNDVQEMLPGGASRYPIVAIGDKARPMQGLRLEGNVVIGPGRAWIDEPGGTADQISVINARRVVVRDNVSRLGGDMGITIANTDDMVIEGNTCTANDTAGIFVGRPNEGTSTSCTIRRNTLVGNGLNRTGRRLLNPLSGVRMRSITDVVIEDNTFGSDPTQRSNISMQNCHNVTIGKSIGGVGASLNIDDGGNTDITERQG